MFKLILLGLLATLTRAAPGYLHGFGLGPVVPAPQILPAPVFSAPIFKAPMVAPAPIYAPAPIVKTIGVAPATSYATVTKVHIAHPAPIVKTILAPQPIVKSYYPTPLALGHGYH